MNNQNWMAKALILAAKGRPRKNPFVGAVVVKEGRIIGQGFHEMEGGPHAEAQAIKEAGDNLSEAVLYCSLEPCFGSWPGKVNPPCTDLILQSGIRQVFIASLDPNPRVKGQGVKALRKAGIQVEVGLLQEEERYLNRRYRMQHLFRTPYVHLKMAQTLDGRIAESFHQATTITGKESQQEVHRLRGQHQGILVGKGTALADDPQLTVRMVKGEQPLRIVIDSRLEISPLSNLCQTSHASTLVYYGEAVDPSKVELLSSLGVELQQLPVDFKEKIYLPALLEDLQNRGIYSLLVEGGSRLAASFLEENLVDEVSWFIHPRFAGKGVSCIDSSLGLWDQESLQHTRIKTLGRDFLLQGLTERGAACLRD